MNAPRANHARALAAWGAGAPDWVLALAAECDRTSQGRAAKRLGRSATVVNQVLNGAYKGRLEAIETRVRGELMRAVVICPVLGEISTRKCDDEQSRLKTSTNILRTLLRQTCPGCPHYRKGGQS